MVGLVIVVLGLGGALAFVVLDRTPASPTAPARTPVAAKTEPDPSAGISQCVTNYDGRYGAIVKIINNSDQVQGYTVEVAFDSTDGTQQVDTGSGTVSTVQPHEQTNLYAIGTQQAPDAQPVPTATPWDAIRQGLAAPPRSYHCRITGFVTH